MAALATWACSRGSDDPEDVNPNGSDNTGGTGGTGGTTGEDAGPSEGGAIAAGGEPVTPGGVTRAPGRTPGGAFVQLFEWRWEDIAKECESYLGPAGFDAVQISPPHEHAMIAGRPWWERYQPVSYNPISRSGNAAEFADMVSRCADVGVAIYVDAVINHMTAQGNGTGTGGTRFTKYEYAGLYSAVDFHSPTCTIAQSDYASNADNVRNCELLGLSDLNTGDPAVQQRIAEYLIRLIDYGVRGFRIDAAKHMAPEDLDAILNRVSDVIEPDWLPFYFLEVIDHGGEAIAATEYLDVGATGGNEVSITEFKFSGVGGKFLGDGGQAPAELQGATEAGWSLLPSDRAVTFTHNHDTQRQTAIFYGSGVAHDLANVFLLAWPYGYPKLMSGYAIDRTTDAGRAAGPVMDVDGNTIPIYGDSDTPNCATDPASAAVGDWVCEHRAPYVAPMVAFRAEVAGTDSSHWWDNGAAQIAFARGDRGFVVINGEDSVLEESLPTGLPEGDYCDVISGSVDGGACVGSTIHVDATGEATLSVDPQSAQAIHVGALLP